MADLPDPLDIDLPDAPDLSVLAGTTRVMIVVSPYYREIATALMTGTAKTLAEHDVFYDTLSVPGAFEIPAAIGMVYEAIKCGATRRHIDGFIALGCVIRGETSHYDYVCGESARGLQDLALHKHIAIGYGILTVETAEQALERAAPDRKDKGRDAALACLSMIAIKRRLGLSTP